MDELAILRDQVSTERRHMSAVKNACRAALAAGSDAAVLARFCEAASGYLVFSVRRLHAQDHAHCLLLRPRVARADEASRRLLDDLEATLRQSRTALQALESAPDPVAGSREYIVFFDEVLAKRRHQLEPLLAAHYSIDDWRASSFVDADSILEERERFAEVRAALPAGISLEVTSGRPGG